MKTSELTGPALDWAVALAADCLRAGSSGYGVVFPGTPNTLPMRAWSPTKRWAQGGPIIERERITVRAWDDDDWAADKRVGANEHRLALRMFGPTPLIAAMRCFVASKLGDEIELPGELMEGESK